MSTRELLDRGVAPHIVSFRKWRRERGLTRSSMATMIGISVRTLDNYEHARCGAQDATKDKIAAFLARWERVPAARDALEAEVRRTKLRYRAAALARCKARGFKVSP